MRGYKDFATSVQDYFCKYMANEVGASQQTIRSYRDTFCLFIEYMEDRKGYKPDTIGLECLNRGVIVEFLDWLQVTKGCQSSTRNVRFAALRSYFRYLMYVDPVHLSQWKNILTIRFKKEQQNTVNHLTIEGIKCLLEQVDASDPHGRRNLTLLSLMYNTGARVQEMINLSPGDIRVSKPYTIELFGKGNKKRIVPLDENMMALLLNYIKENGLDQPQYAKHPLFFNSRGARLTNPGITYVVKKYADMARSEHPDLIPEMISPHVLRHSKAMHLLQAGVNLIYIRDLLGHVSVQTTEVYARADSKAKREALEKAYSDIGLTTPTAQNSWERDPKLKAFLKSLG